MPKHNITAKIGLTGFSAKLGGINTSSDHEVQLEMPERFNMEHIKVAQRDFEMLAQIAREHPKEMVELQNAVLDHNFPKAKKIADQIGLDEDQFVSRGGGFLYAALVTVAAVLAVVIAWEAIHNVDRGDETENAPPEGNAGEAGSGSDPGNDPGSE
jgi:hypothetical protein